MPGSTYNIHAVSPLCIGLELPVSITNPFTKSSYTNLASVLAHDSYIFCPLPLLLPNPFKVASKSPYHAFMHWFEHRILKYFSRE